VCQERDIACALKRCAPEVDCVGRKAAARSDARGEQRASNLGGGIPRPNRSH